MMLGCSNSEHRANHRTPVWWTGDNFYDTLATGVSEMVDGGVNLRPWVHQDCAAHHGPGVHGSGVLPSAPYPPEVYIRWVQFCSLGTITRLHSDPVRGRQPWNYGDDALRIAKSFLSMRNSLAPTLVAAAHRTASDGTPIVRRCDLEWPAESPHSSASTQYLLGDDLLVVPIDPFLGLKLEGDPNKHIYRKPFNADASVWLPPGEWHDAFTGQLLKGNRTIAVTNVSIDSIPLYHRSGGLVIGAAAPAQTIAGIDWARLVVHVWPTRAAFTGDGDIMPEVTRALQEPGTSLSPGAPTLVTKTEHKGTGFGLHITGQSSQSRLWVVRVYAPVAQFDTDGYAMHCNGETIALTQQTAAISSAAHTPFAGAGAPAPPNAAGEVVEAYVTNPARGTDVTCTFLTKQNTA